LDADNSGSIKEEEILKVFGVNNIDTRDPNRIVELFGCEEDKTISYHEF